MPPRTSTKVFNLLKFLVGNESFPINDPGRCSGHRMKRERKIHLKPKIKFSGIPVFCGMRVEWGEVFAMTSPNWIGSRGDLVPIRRCPKTADDCIRTAHQHKYFVCLCWSKSPTRLAGEDCAKNHKRRIQFVDAGTGRSIGEPRRGSRRRRGVLRSPRSR